ncbi:probable ubiquitin receptor RAD23a [Lolium rigidum]|uniref:probable ubiquitin receptor RAD23a n=1 Tax=Lolium rigidum TaxID=89674 RepID=UPI001F5CF271|nr:probable ubiquitin receptor RAD23a [Lolium rigidum]
MKMTVKTLEGIHFEIRVQHHDTIMAVKTKIEEIKGKDSYPRGQQMLIYKGEVLKDESTLDKNQVTEDKFLIVMLCKSKALASSGTSSAKPLSTPVSRQAPPIAQPQASQSMVSTTTTAQPEIPNAEYVPCLPTDISLHHAVGIRPTRRAVLLPPRRSKACINKQKADLLKP